MNECVSCTCAKCIPVCVQELVLGVTSFGSTDVIVYFKNTTTGRTDQVTETTEVDGTLKVDVSSFDFMAGNAYEVWATLTTATSINDAIDIVIGLDTVTCLDLPFIEVFDTDSTQASFTSQTIELCTPTVDPDAPISECMLKKEFTLTSAEILDLHNTDVEIIRAPGANKVIVPIKLTGFLDFNSAGYTGGSKGIAFVWGTAPTDPSPFAISQAVTISVVDLTGNYEPTDLEGAIGALIVNAPVNAMNLFAAFITGDSPIKGSIHYIIQDA